MPAIAKLTFNPFRENTYIIHDESGECIIIDPGCYGAAEENELAGFIAAHRLRPVLLLNTHCHIDHVLGNQFIHLQYGLSPRFHALELPVLEAIPSYAAGMGINYALSPRPESFIAEGDTIVFGHTTFKVLFTPGHSPGSLSFYSREDKMLISGDVLFYESVGRTDFPHSSLEDLTASIQKKLYTLEDDTVVYAGHGWETSIGHEKKNNPFVRPAGINR